jgi:hypothetical protein
MSDLTLVEGSERVERLFERRKRRPVIIAVYGIPNSGKSFFIESAARKLMEKGISVDPRGGSPRARDFECIKDNPNKAFEVYLHHCGWLRSPKPPYDLLPHEDPNVLCETILNRKVDLNIAVYNSRVSSVPHCLSIFPGDETIGKSKLLYDFTIRNPDSVEKIYGGENE